MREASRGQLVVEESLRSIVATSTMLSLEQIAFRSYRRSLLAARTPFEEKQALTAIEWNSLPDKDRGLVCWLFGSNYERDHTHPELLIRAEVEHRCIAATIAANDPDDSWGGYESEEAIDGIDVDYLGRLVGVTYRPDDNYVKAAELAARLRRQREWNARVARPVQLLLSRADALGFS